MGTYCADLLLNELWEEEIFPLLSLRDVLRLRCVAQKWASGIARLITYVELSRDEARRFNYTVFSNLAEVVVPRKYGDNAWFLETAHPSSLRNIRGVAVGFGPLPTAFADGQSLEWLVVEQNRSVTPAELYAQCKLRSLQVSWYAEALDLSRLTQFRHLSALELVGFRDLTNENLAAIESLSVLALSETLGAVTEIRNPRLVALRLSYVDTSVEISETVRHQLRVLVVGGSSAFKHVLLEEYPALELLAMDKQQSAHHPRTTCEVANGDVIGMYFRHTGFYHGLLACYGYAQRGWRYQRPPPMHEVVEKGTLSTEFIYQADIDAKLNQK